MGAAARADSTIIIEEATTHVRNRDRDQVTLKYAPGRLGAESGVDKYFSKSTLAVKASVKNRFVRERANALEMLA